MANGTPSASDFRGHQFAASPLCLPLGCTKAEGPRLEIPGGEADNPKLGLWASPGLGF